MANASRKHFGPGLQGKSNGAGAMTDLEEPLPANKVLSNRDKAQHSDQRSLDSKHIQSEQLQDAADLSVPGAEGAADADVADDEAKA
jgi:hypothetical protein